MHRVKIKELTTMESAVTNLIKQELPLPFFGAQLKR